jgi:hypothetical protein
MKLDKTPVLETDRLAEMLEEPAKTQPVVVVEYRNRGIPSWIFLPLIVVVPLGALVVYHRTVVERYRVQAAQADSLLKSELNRDRALQSLARVDPPSNAVLPVAHEAPVVVPGKSAQEAPPADVTPTAPASGPSPSVSIIGGSPTPKDSSSGEPPRAAAPPTVASEPGPAPKAAEPSTPVVTAQPAAVAAIPPATTQSAKEGDKPPVTETAASDFPGGEQPHKLKLRTILPKPSGDEADLPIPPKPGAGLAIADDARIAPESGTVKRADTDATSAKPDRVPDQPAAEVALVARGPQPEVRLPTKEESEREIQEEAARRAAELRAQNDTKSNEARAQRAADQLKFRDELADLLRREGMKAGPEIEALAKRFGFERDPDKMAQAHHIWRVSRMSQVEKVRAVRSLDLPEAVVLDFLSNDIFRTMGTRNGPKSTDEVRVRAAVLLIKSYPLPKSAAVRSAPAGAQGADAGARPASATRKTVVSTPR